MKKKFTRTLAVLLSLAMIFSLMPMSVFATEGYSVNSVTVSDGPVEEGQYEVTAYSTISGECLLRVTFYDAVSDEFSTSGDCYYDELMLQGVSPSSPKTVNAAILFYPRDIPANYVVRACLCNLEETEVYAGYGPTSGKCGTNLTWSLNTSTGVLTISGTGAMYDYNDYIEAPWFYFMNSIRSVVIGSGVTSISECAFERVAAVNHSGTCDGYVNWSFSTTTGVLTISGNGDIPDYQSSGYVPWSDFRLSIQEIVVCSGVTGIGDYAFANCINVTDVQLPVGLTYIGENAFANCASLQYIHIPETVNYIKSGAFNVGTSNFYICSGWENGYVAMYASGSYVNFQTCTHTVASADACGDNATWSFDSNTGTLTISGTGNMYDYNGAISYPWVGLKDSIVTVNVESGITAIGNYAFQNYTNLETVNLTDGLFEIHNYAFWGCSSLDHIHLSPNTATIGTGVFTGCGSGVGSFYICSNIADSYPSTYASANNIAFQLCDGHGNNSPFGTCGANATWSLNTVTGVLNIDGTGAMSDYSYDYDGINTPWNSWADSINTVNIGSGITRVGNMAFCDCYYVTEVNLPDGLTSIGNYAFEGCGITDVTIPSSVTAIGECAFASCLYLTDVYIPFKVASIGNMAFHECGSLTAFTVDSNNANYSSDEYGVLYNKAKTLLIQYPNGDCSTEFTVPDSVTTIGNYAFANNDTLTNVTLPEGLTIINGSAFFGSELEYVHIPTTVIFIGNSAFDTNNPDFYLCSNPHSDVVFEYADDNDIPYTVCEHGVSEPEPCPTAVTVSGPGSVTYNGTENHNEQMLFTEPGAKIDLVANEGAENNFLYWVNAETNRVLSFENEYSFTVSPGTRIQARFYEPESEGNHLITYLSNAGNIIEEFDVPVGVTVTPPTPTKLPGYNFTGWSMSAEDASLTSENVVITPNYTKLSGTFTVTITNASGTRGAGTYERDSVATVSALGENFSYWVDANNEKVSYYPTYSFTVICDTVLTAVYNQPESESIACRISNAVPDNENGTLTVYEEWSVGKKYEVDSTGFVLTLNPTVGADDSALRIGGTNVNKTTSKYHTRNGVYSLTLTGWNSGKTVYIRPYVVIRDSTGQHTIYGNIRSYTAAA